MSTLLGVFARNGRPVDAEEIATMARPLTPRCVDARREWRAGPVGFGLLQLHETPECVYDVQPCPLDARLAAGKPPDVVIVADCRIDNRAELAEALRIPGALLDVLPDSQLILAAYLHWGGECLRRLLGDYAFAIWDGRSQTLLCGRDPLGIKPFYYHLREDLFVMASDIRAVAAHPQTPRRVDEQELARKLRYVPHIDPRTTYLQNVVKLPPAHTLTLSAQAATLQHYWLPEEVSPLHLPTIEEYVEQGRALLEDAVRVRIRSAHPIGAHLSGGLDSSSIAVLAARMLRAQDRTLPTYNWQATPDTDDDVSSLEYAGLRNICAIEGLSHQNAKLTAYDLTRQLRQDICLHHDLNIWYEPLVRRMAADDGVRVLLSGWGGDELISFNGRGWRSEQFRRGRWRELLRDIWVGPSFWRRSRRTASVLYHHVFKPSLPDAVYRALHARSQSWLQIDCVTPGFARMIGELPPAPPDRVQRTVHATQLWLLAFGHLAQRTEIWAGDGAQDGMVYRFPLLDRRLVEYSLAVPGDLYMDGRMDRYLFRRMVEGLLPSDVQWGNVKGENIRVRHLTMLMETALKTLLTHDLNPDIVPNTELIDFDCLVSFVRSNRLSTDPVTRQVSLILMTQVLNSGSELSIL